MKRDRDKQFRRKRSKGKAKGPSKQTGHFNLLPGSRICFVLLTYLLKWVIDCLTLSLSQFFKRGQILI